MHGRWVFSCFKGIFTNNSPCCVAFICVISLQKAEIHTVLSAEHHDFVPTMLLTDIIEFTWLSEGLLMHLSTSMNCFYIYLVYKLLNGKYTVQRNTEHAQWAGVALVNQCAENPASLFQVFAKCMRSILRGWIQTVPPSLMTSVSCLTLLMTWQIWAVLCKYDLNKKTQACIESFDNFQWKHNCDFLFFL